MARTRAIWTEPADRYRMRETLLFDPTKASVARLVHPFLTARPAFIVLLVGTHRAI